MKNKEMEPGALYWEAEPHSSPNMFVITVKTLYDGRLFSVSHGLMTTTRPFFESEESLIERTCEEIQGRLQDGLACVVRHESQK